MKKFISLIVLASLAVSCNRPAKQTEEDYVRIGKKEVIHSNVLNEDRPVWVYVPPYSMNSGKKFSVLYLLDGDAHFHSVTGLIQILGTGVNGTNLVPEMIVVAIPNTDRTRDLTPSHSMLIDGKEQEFLKTSGGGNNFLKFIQSELIPHIEANYPTHPYRMLVGHSFGGIAAINALYTMPETFDAYIAIDPSLWWNNRSLLTKADTFFSTKKLDDKSLFISQANTLAPGEDTNDHFGAIKDYADLLASPRNTSGIHWGFKYYPDDSHGSVPLISEYDGLRFIFKEINPDYAKIGHDPQLLEKHFARYKMPVPEGIVNNFGYAAMEGGDLELAEKYFRMNLDANPNSSNAFDSMGEFWLKKGDTLKAVTHYEKALQLDPQNENARSVINRLLEKRK